MPIVNIEVFQQFSPRIIRVPAPVTDVTVQDLYNAVRDYEDELADGIQYPKLITGAGKEALGGGVAVGITITLQNAQLMFQTRPTVLSSGSATLSSSPSNNVHVLTDTTDGTFVTDGVVRGDYVYNFTTRAMETIIVVDSESSLKSLALSGSVNRNTWEITDEYLIYPNDQCTIAGGNLVAVDAVGAEIDSILTSPNTQVVRTSAASATLLTGGLTAQQTTDAVWDATTTDYQTPGTTGQSLTSGSAGGLSSAETADAVWGADPDSYKAAGSFGQWFRKIFWGAKRNT